MSSGHVSLEPAWFGLMQNWEDLLFAHWKVEVADLRPLIPPILSVDTFEGDAYVSIAPFRLTGFRETYLPPIPGLSSFLEVNCRTYVHLAGEEHGVWFFSLDADQALAVAGARLFYSLPYFPAEMSRRKEAEWTVFESMRTSEKPRRGFVKAKYRPGSPVSTVPGTLAHFLTERYELYSSPNMRDVSRARVHHDAGELREGIVDYFSTDLMEVAGVRPIGGPIYHYWEHKKVQADLPEKI